MPRVYKYHGTGNDFAVVDQTEWGADVVALAPYLCDRNRGVGGDGVIIVGRDVDVDATMVIINRDGSRPEMCGNGIRCVARHLVEHHGMANRLRVRTDAGVRACHVRRDGDVWEVDVDMGVVSVGDPVTFDDGARTWSFIPVDVGNPHAVVFEQPPIQTVDDIGRRLNAPGEPFPDGVNVEFVARTADARLDVVVFERGVGRTNACGTGACAAAFAGWESGIVTSEEVVVGLPGGDLSIRRKSDHVWMCGAAEFVFEATLDDAWLRSRTKQ